jgi:hypothetical protein
MRNLVEQGEVSSKGLWIMLRQFWSLVFTGVESINFGIMRYLVSWILCRIGECRQDLLLDYFLLSPHHSRVTDGYTEQRSGLTEVECYIFTGMMQLSKCTYFTFVCYEEDQIEFHIRAHEFTEVILLLKCNNHSA